MENFPDPLDAILADPLLKRQTPKKPRRKSLALKDPKRKKFGASKTTTYKAPKAATQKKKTAKTKAAKGLTAAQIKAKLKAHNSKCPVVKVTGTKTQLQAQLRKISAPSGLAGMAYARTAGMAYPRTAGMAYPRTAGHRGRGCGCR